MITYTSSNKTIDYLFGSSSFVVPSTLYFGLSTTPINIDGTGATEPSGGGYARVPFVNNKTNWSSASNGIITNSAPVTFPTSTASWGTITTVFIADASTSGNIWFYDTLTPSRSVASSTTVLFAIGAITIQMNNT